MLKKLLFIVLLTCFTTAHADKRTLKIPARHEVKLFFGLSIPTGGTVSASDWDDFQKKEIASTFDGFNVLDSTGFYKGEAEPSKIVTFIVKDNELNKVKKIAESYAQRFHQDSVMMLDDALLRQEFVVEKKK